MRVENNTLTISGQRKMDNEVKGRAIPPRRADVRQLQPLVHSLHTVDTRNIGASTRTASSACASRCAKRPSRSRSRSSGQLHAERWARDGRGPTNLGRAGDRRCRASGRDLGQPQTWQARPRTGAPTQEVSQDVKVRPLRPRARRSASRSRSRRSAASSSPTRRRRSRSRPRSSPRVGRQDETARASRWT